MAQTDPEVVAQDEQIVDFPLVRAWLFWAFGWTVLTPLIGILLSLMFSLPDYLGTWQPLSFGRLRPLHINGVIYGAFTTFFLGLTYYVVPRLTGVPVAYPRWGWFNMWVWNVGVAIGLLSIAFGLNQGLEVAEFPLFVDIAIEVVLVSMTIQFLLTIARRREKRVYVSLWYLMAALIWTDMAWVLGNFILPYAVPGISNAALHGLYLHYTVGLWITPAGYVIIYYFLPPAVRNPLYSHKLSLIGFWSLAFFYPLVGTHHYLFSPIADFTETIAIVASMALIIPVWTVTQNFLGTMGGRWREFQTNHAVRFLIIGAIFYLFGCFQGSVESLRTIQLSTHFTDFVIGHSHITVAGTFVLWAIGGCYYLWPKLCGVRAVHSEILARWSFWLATIGMAAMTVSLGLQGILQGTMLGNGVEFVDSLRAMQPYWWARTFFGITFDAGLALSVLNFYLTWRRREASPATVPRAAAEGASA